ncbi:hypothetical protein JHD50_00645 [Sulfurimonas sp. MAG313]|nr:hypothetical protein [Sulfurimonas sp. MAG313]MDF1879822.1 hypothetical protein [Sulfurimonas sp. MAG313]
MHVKTGEKKFTFAARKIKGAHMHLNISRDKDTLIVEVNGIIFNYIVLNTNFILQIQSDLQECKGEAQIFKYISGLITANILVFSFKQ